MRIVTNALHWWFLQVPQMVHHLELVRAAAPPSIPPKKQRTKEVLQMAGRTRPYYLTFRVTENEMQKIKNKIAKSGKTRQDYLLACALQKEVRNTDGLKMLLPELKRIGSNLNQITKVLNATGHYESQLMTENQKELNDLWQQLRQQIARLD